MVEVEQAIQILCDAVQEMQDTVELDILTARGYIAAQDIASPLAVPRFARSAMDGYALRSQDIRGAGPDAPVNLRVLGQVLAGEDKHFAAQPGAAVRIMTGGAVPTGYDCVLRQEDSDGGTDVVAVYQPLAPGENYCPAGEDLTPGQLAVPQNTRLTSHHIGILAGMGLAHVQVRRPFRVGIVATGSELAMPGAVLAPAQIYASSCYAMAAQLQKKNVYVNFIEICPDEAPAFCAMMEARIEKVDAVLTTGGVSVGIKDFVPDAMQMLGAQTLFHRVNMKPGTPMLASLWRGKPVLSLSGNPFAALVNFQVFFWPMLAKVLQNSSLTWQWRRAVLREGTMKESSLRRFMRARQNWEGVSLYTKNHRASVLSNMGEANCIVDQPPGTPLAPGDEVQVLCWEQE